MSFALQLERMAGRGPGFRTLFVRRQVGLLAIGVVHAIILSAEDILVLYALLGFALLLFRRAAPRTILAWSVALYLVSFIPAEVAVIRAVRREPPSATEESASDRSHATATYRTGTFRAIAVQRVTDYLVRNPATVPAEYPRKFAFFLVGLLIVRLGVLADTAFHRRLFARAARLGLLIGLLGRAALFLCYLSSAPAWARALRLPLAAIANPALALGYAATIVLAFDHAGLRALLRPLAAVGRTALTNYILQSLVCTTIFYGYGLGLYGTLGPLPLLEMTVAIFAAQIAVSAWWLRRFRLGPLEWAWRSFTYRSLQPMSVTASSSPPGTNCPR